MFIKTPMGFQMQFENGWTASVQFGIGNYCDNRDIGSNSFRDIPRGQDFFDCENAEIAAWPTESRRGGRTGKTTPADDGGWYKFSDGQEVLGWQSTAQVLEFLQLVAKFEGE